MAELVLHIVCGGAHHAEQGAPLRGERADRGWNGYGRSRGESQRPGPAGTRLRHVLPMVSP